MRCTSWVGCTIEWSYSSWVVKFNVHGTVRGKFCKCTLHMQTWELLAEMYMHMRVDADLRGACWDVYAHIHPCVCVCFHIWASFCWRYFLLGMQMGRFQAGTWCFRFQNRLQILVPEPVPIPTRNLLIGSNSGRGFIWRFRFWFRLAFRLWVPAPIMITP